MDWNGIFGLSVLPLELVVRGSAMYLFLFVLFVSWCGDALLIDRLEKINGVRSTLKMFI